MKQSEEESCGACSRVRPRELRQAPPLPNPESRIPSPPGVINVALWMVAGTLITPTALAFTVERSAARYADRQYQCELTLMLAAPIERVEAVLRDYESYPTLDARILDARVVERPRDNVALLATTLRACFGPFCRNVKRLERVEEAPNALDAITDSARSDVKFGETRTRLEATSTGGTRVTYTTRITPGFWIPPLVGRRWMLNTLEQSTREVFRNVEKRATEAPPHSF